MSRITLRPLDDGQKEVEIPFGKTTIGRGPFLGCSDKKVSRNHAVLEVTSKGEVFLTPTHVNPCFYQPTTESPGQILKKDVPHKLENGDSFSLLPRAFRYQLLVAAEDKSDQNDLNKQSGKTNGAAADCEEAMLNERSKDNKAGKGISNEELNDGNIKHADQGGSHNSDCRPFRERLGLFCSSNFMLNAFRVLRARESQETHHMPHAREPQGTHHMPHATEPQETHYMTYAREPQETHYMPYAREPQGTRPVFKREFLKPPIWKPDSFSQYSRNKEYNLDQEIYYDINPRNRYVRRWYGRILDDDMYESSTDESATETPLEESLFEAATDAEVNERRKDIKRKFDSPGPSHSQECDSKLGIKKLKLLCEDSDSDSEDNADLLFFKSLLPFVEKFSFARKAQFRTAVHNLMLEEWRNQCNESSLPFR